MFKLISLLLTPEGRITLLVLFACTIAGGIYYSVFDPSPEYEAPLGYRVTTICGAGGRGCNSDGSVILWTTPSMSQEAFGRSPKAVACTATKSTLIEGEWLWRIDCGLWQGSELPIIEGWVPEEYLVFHGWTDGHASPEEAQAVQQSIGPSRHPTPAPVSQRASTPESSAGCARWSQVTRTNEGEVICVEGSVHSAYSVNNAFFVTFSGEIGDFYIVSYDWVFPDVRQGDCVKARGKVRMLGASPVIVIEYLDDLYKCE